MLRRYKWETLQGKTHYADEMHEEEDEVVQVQTREETQNPADTAAGEPTH